MTDIIESIFDYISMDGGITSAEYRKQYKRAEALWDSVRPVLDPEIIEKLKGCYLNIEEQSNLEWFREGLRVGLSLVIEAL